MEAQENIIMQKTKPKLTKKQRGFVKDYLETGNATQAVLKNYNVKDRIVAKSVGSENLSKPYIRDVIQEALSDELLEQKHLELLNAVTLQRFTFKVSDDDDVIRDTISKLAGHEVIYIREDADGKTAYIRIPDANTQDKALDKAYKIKGTYAPEKHSSIVLNIDDNARDKTKSAISRFLQRD